MQPDFAAWLRSEAEWQPVRLLLPLRVYPAIRANSVLDGEGVTAAPGTAGWIVNESEHGVPLIMVTLQGRRFYGWYKRLVGGQPGYEVNTTPIPPPAPAKPKTPRQPKPPAQPDTPTLWDMLDAPE